MSSEADSCKLSPLGDQATGRVPDEARLVDPPGIDELRPLQDAHRTGCRQGADVGRELEGGDPAGALDVERGGREGVDGIEEGARVERLAGWEGEPSPKLGPARLARPVTDAIESGSRRTSTCSMIATRIPSGVWGTSTEQSSKGAWVISGRPASQ